MGEGLAWKDNCWGQGKHNEKSEEEGRKVGGGGKEPGRA